MSRKNASPKPHSGHSWDEIIDLAEAKLRQTKARAAQIEGIIAACRGAMEAGDPCPDELIAQFQAQK